MALPFPAVVAKAVTTGMSKTTASTPRLRSSKNMPSLLGNCFSSLALPKSFMKGTEEVPVLTATTFPARSSSLEMAFSSSRTRILRPEV